MFKVNNKNTRTTSILLLLLLSLDIFHFFSSISIVTFELVNVNSIDNYALLFPYHRLLAGGLYLKKGKCTSEENN